MSKIHIEVSQPVPARPETVYGILADYKVGHPAILPQPPFSNLKVLQGGYGAGTEITFQVTAMGSTRNFHQLVSEPEPGRILMEQERDGSVTTRFIVEPTRNGSESLVTISTEITPSPGIQGWIERLLVPRLNRRLYKQELEQLAEYAQKQERESAPQAS